MAHDREDNNLANLQLGRVNTVVQALNLANGSSESLSQVEESVTGLDGTGADTLAEGVGADGNEDDLSDVDDINVLDLRVLGDERVEGDVEGGGDGGQGVAGADVVGGSDTRNAGLGGLWDRSNVARGVVGGDAVGWDGQDLARLDQVDVLDVVGGGDVADAGVELLGNAGEGVTGRDSVVGECSRATDG